MLRQYGFVIFLVTKTILMIDTLIPGDDELLN